MTIELPPPDERRSPVTGWTREHWVAVADHLLAWVVPFATTDFAQYRLPGRAGRSGPVSDGLEGYARTFLLAAFRIAGSGGNPPPDLVDRYTRGLVAGTDPGHPFAWPALADMSQQLVEAASIAVALHETRPWIFDRLPASDRDRVLAWLAGCVGKRTPDSNWILFKVVVGQFLAEAGGPHDPAEITDGLDRIEAWYAGDGWYSDGAGQNFDYYCGWAMLLYPVLWARMSGRRDHPYAARLRAFLEQYQHVFAADGAPVHQGRSLTYRFATVAPVWLGALTGDTPLPPGRTRRIASGVLRHFHDRGAPDDRGLLTLGWYDEFLPTVQGYSGPASPYWASKAFLGLLLPADHPVWTAVEEPAPIDSADTALALPGPGWLLHGTRADGIVRLVNHGSDRADRPTEKPGPDPHYTRIGYSTHTGPVLTGGSTGVDGQLTVTAPDGTTAQRRRIGRIGAHDRFAASWFADGPVRVATASVVDGPCEVRVHVVEAPAGYRVRDGGYPVAGAEAPAAETGDGRAVVRRADGLTAAVLALHGFDTAGVVRAVDATAFGAHAATPFVAADHPGGTAVYVSLVVLSGVAAAWTARVVAVVGTDVTVRLPGGDTVTVRLPGQQPVASTAQRARASIFERVTADGRTVVWPPDPDRS